MINYNNMEDFLDDLIYFYKEVSLLKFLFTCFVLLVIFGFLVFYLLLFLPLFAIAFGFWFLVDFFLNLFNRSSLFDLKDLE